MHRRHLSLFAAAALAFAAVPSTADAVTVPIGMLDEAATASAPAVRVDPPCDNECIIRAVWPDQLEDRAVRIAYRESRLTNHVRTWCCFGLLQVHKMHLAWLCPDLGICTAADLYDPWLNARAALALYERDGWQPWSTT